ncbi:MAG: PmoA family protein [Acidobacteria bacterium]|nr:PmoA family protein [Acidobacteriota bacterium]
MRLSWCVAAAALAALPLAAQGPFSLRDLNADSVELAEGGKPVFVYNHGMVLANGAPEAKRRSSYLHPVYAPDGTVLTDDFPRDHWHHRGIFWTWPIVRAGGVKYDAWLIEGIKTRFVRWIQRQAPRLAVENGWFAGDRKLVTETVEIVAHPTHDQRRVLDFRIVLEAAGIPVELEGEPAQEKGYGGFSVRFAPRQETVITTDKGAEARDTDMVPHPWAQLEATYSGRRAGLRIDIDPANPAFPNGWCLRKYGFLGVNYPGRKTITLQPGAPLVMKYRVTLYSAQRQ